MKQQEISYKDIMALGFNEEVAHDNVYEEEFGYAYCIITLKLNKYIYLEWFKDTRVCDMVRLSNPKEGTIAARMPIMDLDHAVDMIKFFKDLKFTSSTSVITEVA